MPVNRNALIRYKAIDACLRNRQRKWTLEKLIERVSEALYEYEGISKGISKRTIQADIQLMRSDKLGYNAPIIIVDKKYYCYEDPEYSITNIPLNEQDLGRMMEAVEMLKQFKGFSHFNILSDVVNKLDNHVYAATNNIEPVIDFEKNDQLRGLEHLDAIYNAILQKKMIELNYQSFKAREASVFVFHPWWLKEFKNRWFAIGTRDDNEQVLTLALDRMMQVTVSTKTSKQTSGIQIKDFYKDVVGVTVNPTARAANVKLFVSSMHAPYIETKPIHHSQEVIERVDRGIVIQLKVQLNFELEKEILGYGDGIRVIAPEALKRRIYGKLQNCVKDYEQHM
ncbi:MAG: WYL domain-containing protein [Sphingobacteriales bacterium]|nr:MAG: WYL domain-containing protein [Sphingobacteriales bacterium]